MRASGDWVPTRVDTPGPKLCLNIASIKQRTTPLAIDHQSSYRSSRCTRRVRAHALPSGPCNMKHDSEGSTTGQTGKDSNASLGAPCERVGSRRIAQKSDESPSLRSSDNPMRPGKVRCILAPKIPGSSDNPTRPIY